MLAAVEETELIDHGARRDSSIRSAVLTSFLSKGGTFLLQLVALPAALRVMGRAEFGMFGAVSTALATVALLEVGVGPALAHGISKAGASNDFAKRQKLASTAFFMLLAIAALAGFLAGGVLMTVPIPTLFGGEFAGTEETMRPALWLGLGLFLALFLLNLTDRLREGLLEVSHTNTWGAIGNLLAAAAVGLAVWKIPQVWFLVLAVHGSIVVAKLGNTFSLWKRHPDMLPRFAGIERSLIRHLLSDGAAFATCALLVGFVEYNVCTWLVGHHGGPDAVSLYMIFVQVSVMQLGFVMMVSTPTWPAVAEALARDDRPWARIASRRLYLLGVAFAACAAVGWVTVGPWVLKLWLGEEFAGLPRSLMGAFALYFAAHTWRHLNHVLMIGTGQVRTLARVQLVETVLVAGGATAGLHFGGVPLMMATMGATILLVTGWLLPSKVRRALGE
ncbi:hypothetical protein Hsar01_03134 [Haloferula sargassicola]|uniref:Polysaccharide biosynthesis protein n=2 Tax=Haloferula sargassicola TaxID=490096 RepID=A0ABP9UQS1_9BACT